MDQELQDFQEIKRQREGEVTTLKDFLITKSTSFTSILLYCPSYIVNEDTVAYTDGISIYLGNLFFTKGYTQVEKISIIVHEVLHIALCHISRAKKLNAHPLIWNYAADAVINYSIAQMPYLGLPNDHVNLDGLIEREMFAKVPHAQWSSEMVYKYLIAKAQEPQEGDGDGDGSGGDGDSDSQGNGKGKGKSKKKQQQGDGGGGKLKGVPDGWSSDLKPTQGSRSGNEGKELPDHLKGEAGHDSATREGIWAKRLERAQAGDTPAGLFRNLTSEFPKVKTPWQQYFRRYMKSPLLPKTEDNYSRPARRVLSTRSRIFEPGNKKKSGVARAGIIVDTSGSVDQQLLMQFAAEVEAIQKTTGAELILMYADADVAATYVVKNDGKSFIDKLKRGMCKPAGGGGTDFRPALKDLEQKYNVSVAVYLTDMYGSFPDKAPKGFEVIWASISPNEKAPFGKTVYLE